MRRYLRVGHEFSGLYVDAEEKPPHQMRVPLEIFGKPTAFDPTRGSVAEALVEQLGLRRRRLLRSQEEKGRSWLQGSYLQVCRAGPLTQLRPCEGMPASKRAGIVSVLPSA